MKWLSALLIGLFVQTLTAGYLIPYDKLSVFVKDKEENVPHCVNTGFNKEPGQLDYIIFPLHFAGRYTVGDLNDDGNLDVVVTKKDKINAYTVCGKRLWSVNASINWEHEKINHPYWAWTTYGSVNENRFVHIGADWRTVYVRDGETGRVIKKFDAGPGMWMYALADGNTVYVTGSPGSIRVKAFDIEKAPFPKWSYSGPTQNNAYMPPILAKVNTDDEFDIVHTTAALSHKGEVLWQTNPGKHSVINSAHTLQVRDIDPSAPGKEATYSVYQPKNSTHPSIVSVSYTRPTQSWLGFSPRKGDHPHQHIVCDFYIEIPGLETMARHGNGIDHFFFDAKGTPLNLYKRPTGSYPSHWSEGELITCIDWDGDGQDEILNIERHTRFKEIPSIRITDARNPSKSFIARPGKPYPYLFHGGYTINKRDFDEDLHNGPSKNSWFPYIDRPKEYDDDGPYEGAAFAIDMFGDGREEIIARCSKCIIIYYNTGNAQVKKRRDNPEYLKLKDWITHVYNYR